VPCDREKIYRAIAKIYGALCVAASVIAHTDAPKAVHTKTKNVHAQSLLHTTQRARASLDARHSRITQTRAP
jgi:hypothetical protein